MADADIPTEAEDIFGLNANFKRLTGNTVEENQTAEQLDEIAVDDLGVIRIQNR